jgi:ribose 5-phosphate isomerase B
VGQVKLAIGGDHAGYPLKQHLIQVLKEWGHDVDDLGTHSEDPVDYPPFCAAVARAVVRGGAERGIVLGGSGQGEQISANKVHGARAALCNDLYTARMARAHNDANVLSIGARIVAPQLAEEITRIFLDTPFEGGRHVRRLEEISEIEAEESRHSPAAERPHSEANPTMEAEESRHSPAAERPHAEANPTMEKESR